MKSQKTMPPTYMLISMLLMSILNFVFPIAVIIPTLWNLLGINPVGLGVYIAVVAENAFREAKTTVSPFQESSVLVTEGMYRISRNPMYLGFVLTLVGVALLLRSLTPFGVIPLFILMIESTSSKSKNRCSPRSLARGTGLTQKTPDDGSKESLLVNLTYAGTYPRRRR